MIKNSIKKNKVKYKIKLNLRGLMKLLYKEKIRLKHNLF